EREVVEADVEEEVEPLGDLLDDGRADRALPPLQLQVVEPRTEAAEVHPDEVGDALVALVRLRISDPVAQRLGLEPPAAARAAGADAHERLGPPPLPRRRGVVEGVLDVAVDAAEAVLVPHLAPL